MTNLLRRAANSGVVSGWHPSSNSYTAQAHSSIFAPSGLRLRQTITSSGAVTLPASVTWVYAVIAGGGAASFYEYSGGAGQVVWGWTPAQSTCIVGAGSPSQSVSFGGYTRYGHLIAFGGCPHTGVAPSTNFFGMPSPNGRTAGVGWPGAQGARGSGGQGGNGISGNGAALVLDSSNGGVGCNGGNGLNGGGGASYDGTSPASVRKGGDGGSGVGPTQTYTGGTGWAATTGRLPGGGGAGIAGNGNNATGNAGGAGGLGGGGGGGDRGNGAGGKGGDGVIYLYY